MIARILVLSVAVMATTTFVADARSRRGSQAAYGNSVPDLDVKTSCSDAQKFSTGGGDKDAAYKGCMQDEMGAKGELAKRWSSFKGKDKQDCVEQSRNPSPSYVEVLTCLEMDSGSMQTGGAKGGPPQIGGPVAPGLAAPTGVPNANGVPRT